MPPTRKPSWPAAIAGGALFSAALLAARRLAGGDDGDLRRSAVTTGSTRAIAGAVLLARPDLLGRALGDDARPPRRAALPVRMIAVRELAVGVATMAAARSDDDPRPWLLTLSAIDGIETLVVLKAVRARRVRRSSGLAFAAADAGSAAAGIGLLIKQMSVCRRWTSREGLSSPRPSRAPL